MAPFLPRLFQAETMPTETEVVIIGGGIIGVSAALELAERGIPVVLCEKGLIAGEQSSRNMGWLRKMGREEAELPLAIESLKLWEGLNKRVGADTGYHRSGTAYLFETPEQLEASAAWLEVAKPFNLDTRVVSPGEVRTLFPTTSRDWAGALYTASDARAEPAQATTAIAAAAQRHGVRILSYCAVRSIETKAGKVSGVVTEHGPISCRTVVLAGGAWSGLFCGNHGIDFPQLKIRATVIRTPALAGGPDITCSGPGFVMRKNQDGGYVIGLHPGEIYDITPDSFRYMWRFRNTAIAHAGRLRLRFGGRFFTELGYPHRWNAADHTPFETERTLNPVADRKAVASLKRIMGTYFPSLSRLDVLESWAGMVDVTPDALPVISPVGQLPGLVLASGFSGTGFAQGPAAGRLIAEIITNATPCVDPTPFRLERITEGQGRKRHLSIGGTP